MELQSIQNPLAGAHAAAQAPPAEILAERRQLIRAVKAINEARLLGDRSELTFSFDRATQRPIIRLVNRETQEVEQQIPPEYVLELARREIQAADS